MQTQFWVIGGDYQDIGFTRIIAGTTEVHGPFGDHDEARRVWREQSMANRHRATTRYAIASSTYAAMTG